VTATASVRFVPGDDGELTYRQKDGGPTGPVILMLHGLSGDEDVMWLLTSALPDDAWLAAPRGSFAHPDGGYSWVQGGTEGAGGSLADYRPAVEAVVAWWQSLRRQEELPARRPYLMGFSQGAALTFALAAGGMPAQGVIALAGFVPTGDLSALEGVPVYWGHGAKDDTVPLARAQADVERLQRAGVLVELCVAEVGHKVGVECMRGLTAWLRQRERDDPGGPQPGP